MDNQPSFLKAHRTIYITGIVMWGIFAGHIYGLEIPHLFSLEEWWHWLILAAFALPITILGGFLGLVWFGVVLQSVDTLPKGIDAFATQRWPNSKSAPKILKGLHLLFFVPLFLAAFALIMRER